MRVMPELLHIRWEESPPSEIVCDFCDGVIKEACAVFDGVRGKITNPQGDARGLWIDGPFGACSNCQSRLGIRPGDQEVELAKVRRLFSSEVKRALGHPRLRVGFYGPG